MKNKLGVMMTCYDEIDAVKHSIDQLRLYYPDIKIYLVTESKKDYNLIFKNYKNIFISYEDDTMSFYYNIKNLHLVYQNEEIQNNIKKAFHAFIDRVHRAIEYSNSEYMLLMDPDVLIRGELNIPKNKLLLGSLANKNVPQSVRTILSNIDGAIVINEWGATPGLFHSKTFLKAYSKFCSIPNLLDNLVKNWYAMYAHDIIIPILFALIGEKEHYNDDFTECNTDPNWKTNNKNLVHHFKQHYPNATVKFPWFFEHV
jgi:hypothetical protein